MTQPIRQLEQTSGSGTSCTAMRTCSNRMPRSTLCGLETSPVCLLLVAGPLPLEFSCCGRRIHQRKNNNNINYYHYYYITSTVIIIVIIIIIIIILIIHVPMGFYVPARDQGVFSRCIMFHTATTSLCTDKLMCGIFQVSFTSA
jgi:hypothetical protein